MAATLVSALADHLIWAGNKENNIDENKLTFVFFVMIKIMKNNMKIVNAPNNTEVYSATQLLTPKIPNTILRINGHPIDFG